MSTVMDPDEDAALPILETEENFDPDVQAFIDTLNPAQKLAVTTPSKVLQILAPRTSPYSSNSRPSQI